MSVSVCVTESVVLCTSRWIVIVYTMPATHVLLHFIPRKHLSESLHWEIELWGGTIQSVSNTDAILELWILYMNN